jgi:protoporphyrinogen oxidase
LGARESALIILSRLLAAFKPNRDESTYEQWIINRFGKRMYRLFFKSYTEKVWGIPCTEIHSAWAAQRIQNLSLLTAATGALFGSAKAKSLIDRFNYPSQGPGMMWRRFADSIKQQGGEIIYKAEVFRIEHERRHIKNIVFRINGEEITQPADMVLSSAPITDLIDMLLPKAPESVLRARLRLKHRAFVIVLLVVDHADLFPDQWIYIHSPKVNVCRIQNFKNWSTSMIPDLNTTSLGMEYFCDEGDALWCMSDKDLCDLAAFELEQIGLARKCRNLTGRVIRQSKAYPVYHMGYEDDLKLVKEYLSGFDNLLIMGRNGTHRYNNMDHSMETGYLAARAVLGEYYDTWNVNDEARYLE